MPSAERYHRDLLESCLGLRPWEEADRLAQEAQTLPPAAPDAEFLYYQGALFADCGKRDAALRMLQRAIDQNYCSYSNLLYDPLLRKVRQDPRFKQLLKSAKECQEAVRTPNSDVQAP
jgi:tetratricopeptide (TPR) repeat protein